MLAEYVAPFLSGAGGAGFGLWVTVRLLEHRLNALDKSVDRAHRRIDDILGLPRRG